VAAAVETQPLKVALLVEAVAVVLVPGQAGQATLHQPPHRKEIMAGTEPYRVEQTPAVVAAALPPLEETLPAPAPAQATAELAARARHRLFLAAA
jgi:hypothetical protein